MASDFQVSLQDYQSLLVVKPSSLGDIVHTLPTVRLIKQHAPHLRLRWVCNPEWKPLLQDYQDLTELIEFPRKQLRGISGIGKAFQFAKALQAMPREAPELVIDFQGLLRSAIICKSRKSAKTIGFSDSREGAFLAHDHVVAVSSQMHAVDRYLSVLPHLGISWQPREVTFPLCAKADISTLHLPEKFVLLHPYSRGAGKSLDDASIDALIQSLSPYPVVLVGVQSPHDPRQQSHVLDLVNRTTLSQLIALCTQATACVSVDSGPMHIASAVNPRTLGIHTWSQPSRVGPYLDASQVWKAGRIAPRKQLSLEEDQKIQAFGSSDVPDVSRFLEEHWLS